MKNKRSISVEFWCFVFKLLSYISIFWLVRKIIGRKNAGWWYNFVDIWVLANLLGAIISVFLVKYLNLNIINFIVVGYGLIRVFEIIIYQINVLLFDEYRSKLKGVEYKIRGYRRMIINLLSNFCEITFWFASSFAVFLSSISDTDMSISRLIFNSFTTMTTFGISNLTIRTETGLFILWFQSIAGLLMTLISLSRFLGMLPKVDSMDEFEN